MDSEAFQGRLVPYAQSFLLKRFGNGPTVDGHEIGEVVEMSGENVEDQYRLPAEKIHRVMVNRKDLETWEQSIQTIRDYTEEWTNQRQRALTHYPTNPWLLDWLAHQVWEQDHPELSIEASAGLNPDSLTGPVVVTLAFSKRVLEHLPAREEHESDWNHQLSRLIGIPGWPQILFEAEKLSNQPKSS